MDDPKVISALIAASVSLLVAGISGLYVIYQSNRKLKVLRDELITTKKTERFIVACENFRKAYRSFEEEASGINSRNPEDGTELLQLCIDFHSSYGRDFYKENLNLLKSSELDKDDAEINRLVNSGILNDHDHPDRMSSLETLFATMRRFSSALFDESLKY